MKRQPVKAVFILAAIELSEYSEAAEWRDWLAGLATGFLKASPIYALRAAASVAESYSAFGLRLFDEAFMSCWQNLTDEVQVRFALNSSLYIGALNYFAVSGH